MTGDEFGDYKNIKDLREKAIDFYRRVLQGTSVENKVLGKVDIDNIGIVQFTTEGRRKVKSNSANEDTLLLIKHLPKLIVNATDVHYKMATSEKHIKSGDSFYYLYTHYIRDGKKIPLEITLKKLHTGDIHYYNHIVAPQEYKKEVPVSPRTESPEGANVSKADGTHRLIVGERIEVKHTADKKGDIREATQIINNRIEEHVRLYPEDWFWLHDRWKSIREEF